MHKLHQRSHTPKATFAVQLAVVVTACLAIRQVLYVQVSTNLLPNRIQDFITLSLSIFVEAVPFLILGSILAAVVNTFVPVHAFERILPKRSIFRRFAISLLGFLFPVCECGNVPLSRALMANGLKPTESIVFLLAAPVINPVTIWSTATAFSLDKSIVISRVLATLAIANAIGWLLSRSKDESEYITPDFQAVCSVQNSHTAGQKFTKVKLRQFIENFTHEAFTMMKMLAFGALVAGVVQSFIPRGFILGIGSNVVLAIFAMLLLAFVVSICANVDAFFALSFASTFTAGSLVAFLVFGPMIDIKMLALLRSTFTKRTLVTISLLSLLGSAIAGLVVSYAF